MIRALSNDNIFVEVIIRLLMVATLFTGGISVIAMFSIWWERKVAGHAQSRVGPMHVGGWHGWAQSLADGIKLLLKEDLIPASADSFLFRLAPYLAFAPVFATFLAIPFGPQFCFDATFNIGILYLLAMLAVEVMSTILAGWGSNSKWAIYGAMREACQMVSYEIPLGLAIICGVLVARTLNMVDLGYLQAGGIHEWFVYHNPFIFLAFLLYFIASLASTKRAPFDLPESESELVAGYHTEYSGIRWSLFFFAEYGAMFIVGVIQAILFLGAWNSPLGKIDPVYMATGYDLGVAAKAHFSGALSEAVTFTDKAAVINETQGLIYVSQAKQWIDPTTGQQASALTGVGLFVVNLWGFGWLSMKAMVSIFLQIWIRWTLPRIRIDQVLYCCIKVLLPLSLITLGGTAVWVLLVQPEQVAKINGRDVTHLLGTVSGLQLTTQIVLTVISVAITVFVLGIMFLGWKGVVLNDPRQPQKSLFSDVMPVGDQIAFTGQTKEQAT